MFDSATEILRALQSGDCTAAEITGRSIDAINATQSTVNAFTHVASAAAMQAAEDVDRRRKAGKPLGALAGVPVAVKDLICTTDMPTTCSSKMLAGYTPPYDATVVSRLRAADAIIVGKTNMDEFAMGASTETSSYGVTRNPWDLSCVPGGSSGGAAACVAASMVSLSLGSDTGGSIRQPAAHCGITGLKPTYGRVSRYGLVAFASSLDQIGPMAWSAEDCALLMDVIAGYDPKDSTSLDRELPHWKEVCKANDLRGLKIGVFRSGLDHPDLDQTIREMVMESARVFESLGARLVDIEMPHAAYGVPTYYVVAPSEASSNLSRYDGAHYGHRSSTADSTKSLLSMYCQSRGEGFGAEVKRRIMIGTFALSEGYADQYYNQALKVRRLIKQDYDAAFTDVDLILGPVTPTPAFPLGDKIDDPIQMFLCDLYTVGANLAGVPAISLPGGTSKNGMPIGFQLQAPVLEEPRLLMAAAAYQRITDHHKRRPIKSSASSS
jgi:aspartyl-tRNA(Asn)/glutamyl-tRNA(Gln) amidotransferase subunit A